MIEITIPGRKTYRLNYLVLDLNGTLTVDGRLIDGVRERLKALSERLDIYIVTADTLGVATEVAGSLGIKMHRLKAGAESTQKLEFIQQLGKESVISIGNGANDVAMLRESVLGICVIGPEGAAAEAMSACDLVTTDINTTLDLLLKPIRIIATLRN